MDIIHVLPTEEFQLTVMFRVNYVAENEGDVSSQAAWFYIACATVILAGLSYWRASYNRLELARVEVQEAEIDLEREKLPNNRFAGFVWPLTVLGAIGLAGYWYVRSRA